MAAVNWHKATALECDHLIVHFDKNERLNHMHDNPHIDKSRTYLNYDMDKPYIESLKVLKKKVEEFDKIKPPLKKFGYSKRIIAIELETPCPDNISKLYKGAEDDFFKTIYKCEKMFFGENVVMYGGVHKDEVHWYVNPKTKEMNLSKVHLHTLIIPYEEELGVNGRNFATRQKYIKFNHYVDKAIFNQFHVHLNNFVGKNNWGNVESLKRESKTIELKFNDKDKQIIDLLNKNHNLNKINDNYDNNLYNMMYAFRESNRKEYNQEVKRVYLNEGKNNDVIRLAKFLSEQEYGINYPRLDIIWHELEEEEKKRKKKKELEQEL